MTTKLDGTSLFTGIYSGLTNTYALLAQQYPNGVTLSNITEARTKAATTANGLNQGFAQYMQTNFSSLDKDGNGVISAAELNNLSNQIATQGLSKTQLTQLAAAGTSGMSGSLLETVMSHFDDIDTNHDGKVTNSEIKAYGVTSDKEKKKAEFSNRAATNMSVFYGDESSSAADSSSMLDYKYLSDDGK